MSRHFHSLLYCYQHLYRKFRSRYQFGSMSYYLSRSRLNNCPTSLCR